MIKGVQTYLRGVQTEFSKVTWPSKQQFRQSFIVVVLFVVVSAAIVSAIDYGLQLVIKAIINA